MARAMLRSKKKVSFEKWPFSSLVQMHAGQKAHLLPELLKGVFFQGGH